MAKGKAKASGDRPAEAEVDLQESVGGAAASGEAAQGTQAQGAGQLLQALAQNQASMQSNFDTLMKSLSENVSKLNNITADIAKKQDTNVDESMAGAQGASSNDQVSLGRLVNNQYANLANAAASRSQAHFDTLQTIIQMHVASMQFAQAIAGNLLVADTHQQCSKNAEWRTSGIPSVVKPAK